MVKGLSYLSIKCLRDSTGALYVIATGSLTDPVVQLSIAGEDTKYNLIRLSSGHTQLISRLVSNPLTLRYKVKFQSGKSEERTLSVPSNKQKLTVPFDSLTSSFSETKDVNSQTFSFNDSLQYPEGKGQKQTVVYPASSSKKLDTSSKTDFYYTSDGTFAYVASNDLQNQFLNNLQYRPSGTTSQSVGKFPGGTSNESLSIISSSVTDVNTAAIEGPVVFGEVVAFDLPIIPPPGGKAPLSVCTSPTAENYWLRGCTDETLPCVDSGVTHSQDCDSTTLTAAVINEYAGNYIDGGCCVECDNDLVYTFTNIGDASEDTANGEVTLTVTSLSGAATGDIEYSLLGTPDNPALSFSTIEADLTDQALPYTITYTTLFPGVYAIKAESGNDCTDNYNFTIPEKDDSAPDTTYACTDATAVNYDSGAGLTNVDELCVFCDAVTGNFVAGGENGAFTAPFPVVLPYIDSISANSSPTGTSSTDGILNFGGEVAEWNLWNNDGVGVWNLGEDGFFPFVIANNLNSTQALPFVHTLYKLNIPDEEYITLVGAAILNGTSTKDIVVNNSTLIATQTGNGNQSHSFTDLAAGRYAVITQYNNDGTLDGDDEIEQCYSIIGLTGAINLGQKGCTDPNALNYNSDATTDDGSCNYESVTDDRECGQINLSIKSRCFENQGGWLYVDLINNSDPELIQAWQTQAATNQFSQGPLAGIPGCGSAFGNYNMSFSEYVIGEVFCMDQTNNGALWTDNAVIQPEGYVALPPECVNEYAYSPPTTNTFYPYESGDLFEFTDSNGNALGQYGNQGGQDLNVYRVNFTVTFADGSTQSYEEGLTSLYLGAGANNPNSFPGTFLGAPIQCNGADPVSFNYYYNWGSWDSFEYVYQSPEIPITDVVLDCCETPAFPECTDPTATNYCCPAGTEGVITDNTLCQYEPDDPEIPGCTNPNSPNFNPLATIDDGSCIPQPPPVGSWFCSNAASGECEYIEGTQDGWATQQLCEAKCAEVEEPDDCLELSNWVNTNSGGMTAISTNATSIYNETTGLCDTDSNGTVTVNIPNSSSLDIANPNGVVFVVRLYQNGFNGGTNFVSYYEGGSVSYSNGVPIAGAGDYLSLTEYSGGSFTFDNVPQGCWSYALQFWSDPMSNGVPANQTQYCEGYSNSVCVEIDSCDDGGGGEEVIYGCTDPEAENYNSLATVDDGTCNYPCDPCEGECLCDDGTYDSACCTPDPQSGCTDPLANNYNPNATLDDGSCDYDIVGCTGPCCDGGCDDDGGGGDVDDGTDSIIPGCTPQNMDSLLQYNDQCITTSGNRFYTKLLTGLGDDCSTMEAWKMIIIQEILNRKGLPCVYNCSDESTIQIGAATNDCAARWEDSGSIYWNPTDAVGFGLGTIVKRANGGLGGVIYIAVSTSGLTIDPSSSDSNSGWKKCVTIKAPTDNSDYLEKFVSFAKSYCRDCGISPYTQETETDSSQVSVEVTSGFTVGGSSVTNDGVSYEPPR